MSKRKPSAERPRSIIQAQDALESFITDHPEFEGELLDVISALRSAADDSDGHWLHERRLRADKVRRGVKVAETRAAALDPRNEAIRERAGIERERQVHGHLKRIAKEFNLTERQLANILKSK